MQRLANGWVSHMVMRAKEVWFTRRRRHRPVHYGGREFSTPQLLSDATLPRAPGVYAIQVKHWWSGLKPIHFGASENLHEELMEEGTEGFVSWLTHRGAKRGLWISFRTEEHDRETPHREGAHLFRHFFPKRSHSLDEHLQTHRIHRTPEHRRAVHDRRNDEIR